MSSKSSKKPRIKNVDLRDVTTTLDFEKDPRELLRAENISALKTLIGKTVLIKSNIYQTKHMREYFVEDVSEEYIKLNDRMMRGIRLSNSKVDKDKQPFLKYPTEPITVVLEGKMMVLSLIYSRETNIEKEFKHLHKKTKPDLEIYISYEK